MKINQKLLLIGVGLTVVLVVVASLFSYHIFRRRTLDDMFRSMDAVLDELVSTSESDGMTAELFSLKEYISTEYNSDPNATEGLSSDELLEKCREVYYALYLKKTNVLGLSLASLQMKQSYLGFSRALAEICVIPGVKSAFIGYRDEARDRLIYLVDSEYGLDDKVYEETRLPGSFYAAQEGDAKLYVEKSRFDEYKIGGNYFKTADFYYEKENESGISSREYVATVFIQYDVSTAESSVNSFLQTELIAMTIATVILVVIYFLLAYFVITKNISALNNSARIFTENVLRGENLVATDPKIKARDEIGVLSRSFIILEKEIISYTDRLERDAKERARLSTELSIAAQIQKEELPEKGICDDRINIVYSMTSAKEVGGDFYDYFYLDDGRVAVMIADVTGKGIPAALLMMKAKGIVKNALQSEKDLEKAIYKANNALCENNKTALFVTLLACVIDTESGEMECVSAGHEKPYLVGDGTVEKLNVQSNFVLGIMPNFTFIKDKANVRGKRLFLFTDGLNESINGKGEEFGYGRIEKSLIGSIDEKAEVVTERIKSDLKAFVGDEEPFDDVTLILCEFKKRKKLDITFENPSFETIQKATDAFNEIFDGDIEKSDLSKVDVIIDEMMNNVISYEKAERFFVRVKAEKTGDEIILSFISNGEEFNPLQTKSKTVDTITKSTPLGGFGISIVRSISDELRYERKDELNHIIIKKKL